MLIVGVALYLFVVDYVRPPVVEITVVYLQAYGVVELGCLECVLRLGGYQVRHLTWLRGHRDLVPRAYLVLL